ncbi:glutamine synthetase [Tanacetum coccineum]
MEEIKSQKNVDDVLEVRSRPSLGIASGDELWSAHNILEIDWNGVGAHTNYSTKSMREEEGYEIIKMTIEKLGMRHKEHIAAYGEENERRLTGRHETAVDWNGVGAYLYLKSLHSIVEC